MPQHLNERALVVAEAMLGRAAALRIGCREIPGGGRVLDCGVEAPGGLGAGLELARAGAAGLAEFEVLDGELDGRPLPRVQGRSDHPVAACLAAQYAGWALQVGEYFAMGSGPMRAAYGGEKLFDDLAALRERPARVVGVLEARRLPGPEVIAYLAERCRVPAAAVTLLVAPTASLAGGLQVVARALETALHKLHALGFDLGRIAAGLASAPLPPVAKDDLAAIGRTNDCVLYGGRALLYVRGDDPSLEAIGPRLPSCAAAAHGATFLELFERAGRDFYKLDPLLFSPAVVALQNLDSGRTHVFGRMEPEILARSLFT